MNELLGWYGFEGVDRLDLSTKTSRLLQSAAVAQANNAAITAANNNNANHNNNGNSNNSNSSNNALSQQRHGIEKRRSRSRAATMLQLQQQQSEHIRSIMNNNNNNNNASNKNNNLRKLAPNYRNTSRGSASGATGVANGGGGESTTSDHDTRSSREEDSKSPLSAGKIAILEEKVDLQNCCWCRRRVPENAPEFLTISDGPRYCSESCFTQSRRASFKKAKTCDWCKHVRHAISYVDFNDGASQLQFCSDKCLNQYKMQIFCKETQAHLDMNPHLRERGLAAVASGNSAGLITPDLWLRNCRSRSASPASTLSVSPGPTGPATIIANNTSLAAGSSSSPPSSAALNLGTTTIATHKPMISVAPVSKLMSKNVGMLSSAPVTSTTNRISPKHNRKKRPLRSSLSGNAGAHADLSTGSMKGTHSVIGLDNSNLNVSTANSLLGKSKSLLGANSNNNLRTSPSIHMTSSGAGGSAVKSGPSALSQFVGSSVQDLHMSVPPLSPMLEQQTSPHTLPPHAMNTSGRSSTSMPPTYFAAPTGGQTPNTIGPNNQLPHGPFPPHAPPYLPNPSAPAAAGMFPRFFGAGGFPGYPGFPQHMIETPPDLLGGLGLGGVLGAPPPVTVMVPYPIIIPLLIPIPVPLPVMDFYKAYLSPEERNKLKEEEESKTKETNLVQIVANEAAHAADIMEDSDSEQKMHAKEDAVNEEPLDFTKSKDCLIACCVDDHCDEVASISAQSRKDATSDLKRAASEEPLTTTTTLSPITTTTTTTAVTTSPENLPYSPSTPSKATHCIVRSDDLETPRCGLGEDGAEDLLTADGESDDAKQKLPKFKITRLQTKRTLIQTKESPTTPTSAAAECSRPLRKRKRIIDCDFQKLALKEAAELDGDGFETSSTPNVEAEADGTEIETSETVTACNSNSKTQNKK
ncbi:sine oculis-binding protein homolog A isoform X2 [Eurosta solidaginis]